MAELRELIDTIIIVMMENRSFDHVLGHLSYDNINADVEGLTRPIKQEKFENLFEGDLYYPWKMKDRPLAFDPPHEWDEVAEQLARSPATGQFMMNGFVRTAVEARRSSATAEEVEQIVANSHEECMGFLKAADVPLTSFFARNFTVCDNWFSPLPTSTQPNKTMALCGYSKIRDTKLRLMEGNDIVLDWLADRNVPWRVYHDGMSFFTFYREAGSTWAVRGFGLSNAC